MKVIPLSVLSVPDEGYSTFCFERTWVIPLSVLSVPDEGYPTFGFERT
jgi:hypothetical protein